MATTSNSSPLALWMVMIRTPSWPSTAVAAWASASASARAARKSSSPRRSRPSLARTRPPGASACARWRSAPPRRGASAPRGRSRSRSRPRRSVRRGRARSSGGAGPARVSAKERSSASSASGISSIRAGSAPSSSPRPAIRSTRRPDVPAPAGRGAQEPEGVGSDPARRRGERSQQRLVVERVGDRRQQGADVGDLLLGPVAAAADDVWAQAGALERVLVGVEAGEGAQQDDHRAAVDALVGQLPQPRRQEARLRELVGRRAASVAGSSSIPSSSQSSRPVSRISTAGPFPGGSGSREGRRPAAARSRRRGAALRSR